MNKSKSDFWLTFTTVGVFLGIFVFFTMVHPVIPYDGDDWLWLSQFRHALPDHSLWDPARILAEVLTPMTALFSAYVIYPLTGDYIFSYTLLLALILSGLSTVLYVSLYRLFLAASKNKGLSMLACLLMLVFFFGFFKSKEGSVYLLHALNYTCFFAYTIPSLLNSILVCTLMRYGCENKEISIDSLGVFKLSILVVLSYFAIFSILFCAAILVVYCGYEIIIYIVKNKKLDVGKTIYPILVIAGFFVYCIFEVTGQRANSNVNDLSSLVSGNTLIDRLYMSYGNFLSLVDQANIIFLILSFSVILAALIVLCLNIKKDRNNKMLKPLGMSLLCCISLVPIMLVVSTNAGVWYAGQIQVMYGVFFYFILFLVLSLIYIGTTYKHTVIFIPLILALLAVEASNARYRFDDQYVYQWHNGELPTAKKIYFMNLWIEQMKEADKKGKSEITLQVPAYENLYELPHPDYFAGAFANTLYTHNITSRYINVNLEYTEGLLGVAAEEPDVYEDVANIGESEELAIADGQEMAEPFVEENPEEESSPAPEIAAEEVKPIPVSNIIKALVAAVLAIALERGLNAYRKEGNKDTEENK